VSFQLSGTVTKRGEVKKALEGHRDRQLGDLRRAEEEGAPTQQPDPQVREQLESDLVDAAVAGAEAIVGKLKDASSYQLTASAHRDVNGQAAVSVAVSAVP
jgi:hypothetical protein